MSALAATHQVADDAHLIAADRATIDDHLDGLSRATPALGFPIMTPVRPSARSPSCRAASGLSNIPSGEHSVYAARNTRSAEDCAGDGGQSGATTPGHRTSWRARTLAHTSLGDGQSVHGADGNGVTRPQTRSRPRLPPAADHLRPWVMHLAAVEQASAGEMGSTTPPSSLRANVRLLHIAGFLEALCIRHQSICLALLQLGGHKAAVGLLDGLPDMCSACS